MGFFSEFKQFAMRGNVVDLAVGIVVGAAFGKIVSSFVDQVLMPPIGLLIGGVDFSEFEIVLKKGSEGVDPVILGYGAFIQTIVSFTIIAFAVFLLVKAINSLRRKEEAAPAEPPAPSAEEKLLTEIRDLLKQQAE
ncbi:large-conductance mechanosensitive channel protein MscL [Oceanidesulfovibrio marinus]|uniref:Large-conductance mechanosensitive channel n=1 Tax=Oceanidesulfovibrio marinus TaxID=370038 RepID=A0A6P1ZFL6_9BACT|nr:large-conductance mechanosensitive channel protein MscL [Oceanidesulfovibrio marinus]QJT07922.1 large-conductance mechanosensitive channel protein MscL [Oceanidesulfovibrio marinus]TVM33422.1 large conductance mechanosensitive channel protein MscL [Oceanidesulfovibrio marinus]